MRKRKREREIPFPCLCTLCIHGVFSRKWDEKGQRQREAEGQREGERNRSQVRVHFDNVTTTGCMRRTITSVYIVSAFRFFFLSLFFLFFFFFCSVNAFGRCIIREIVACEK